MTKIACKRGVRYEFEEEEFMHVCLISFKLMIKSVSIGIDIDMS